MKCLSKFNSMNNIFAAFPLSFVLSLILSHFFPSLTGLLWAVRSISINGQDLTIGVHCESLDHRRSNGWEAFTRLSKWNSGEMHNFTYSTFFKYRDLFERENCIKLPAPQFSFSLTWPLCYLIISQNIQSLCPFSSHCSNVQRVQSFVVAETSTPAFPCLYFPFSCIFPPSWASPCVC